MRFIFTILLLTFSQMGLAAENLNDVAYQFDSERVAAADSAYSFMTAFAEYYYLLVDANRSRLPSVKAMDTFNGWCIGDAHPENFGALILRDGSSVFTINDMDDAGPCPLVMDYLRFVVTSKLAESSVQVSKLNGAYLSGLRGETVSPPSEIAKLLEKSRERGESVNPDDVSDGKLTRNSLSRELTRAEWNDIRTALPSPLDKLVLVDAFATAKVGGGSSGVPRYELLFNSKDLLHIELKGQPAPAITKVATEPVPVCEARIQKTLDIEQLGMASPYYGVLEIQHEPMLFRPRFFGNKGVKMTKKSDDNVDTIYYEAYVLGTLHAKTLSNRQKWIDAIAGNKDLEDDVQALVHHFAKKYSDLRQN